MPSGASEPGRAATVGGSGRNRADGCRDAGNPPPAGGSGNPDPERRDRGGWGGDRCAGARHSFRAGKPVSPGWPSAEAASASEVAGPAVHGDRRHSAVTGAAVPGRPDGSRDLCRGGVGTRPPHRPGRIRCGRARGKRPPAGESAPPPFAPPGRPGNRPSEARISPTAAVSRDDRVRLDAWPGDARRTGHPKRIHGGGKVRSTGFGNRRPGPSRTGTAGFRPDPGGWFPAAPSSGDHTGPNRSRRDGERRQTAHPLRPVDGSRAPLP